MTEQELKLWTDALTEMRLLRRELQEMKSELSEMRGEWHEFKKNVVSRLDKLECRDGARWQTVVSVISVIIAAGALCFSCVSEFFEVLR